MPTKEQSAKYREDNKQSINEKRNIITLCGCGVWVRHCNAKRHLESHNHKSHFLKIKPISIQDDINIYAS